MGLGTVLNTATAGLRVTQSALDIVARNVANADTPGYTRKVHNQSAAISGDNTSVIGNPAGRLLDTILQRQLRLERAAGTAADTSADYHGRLDILFGQPGGENALDTRFNDLLNSIQALSTSPDSFTARGQVADEAAAFAQHLNALSSSVQEMRLAAEKGIGSAVQQANDALERLEFVNGQIMQVNAGTANPDLLDERDRILDELSTLMDIRVNEQPNGGVTVFTQSGALLFDRQAVELSFDQRSSIAAEALYSSDPDERGVGTISLNSPNGYSIDLVRDGAFRSGEIKALIDMRDKTLVEAQDQLDELASGMALALSRTDQRIEADAGTGVYSFDTAAASRGDRMRIEYVDAAGSAQTLTLVNVSGAPETMEPSVTGEANDAVLAVDFDNLDAAALTAINDALGGAATADAAGGVLDITPAAPDRVTAVTAQVSATGLQDGGEALALFVDGGGRPVRPYTENYEGGTPQKRGFAGRIAVNPDLLADSSFLVASSPDTAAGDPARPDAIFERLTETRFSFSPQTRIGSERSPFTGTVAGFAQAITAHRGREAQQAQYLAEGQEIVVGALETRYLETSGVNVDEEMAQLVQLQNAFAANARVMSSVQEMMDMLLRM